MLVSLYQNVEWMFFYNSLFVALFFQVYFISCLWYKNWCNLIFVQMHIILMILKSNEVSYEGFVT